MSKSIYGINDDGNKIEAPKPNKFTLKGEPKEWVLIPEGGDIPQQHREYIGTMWCQPRRCHSTMTPMKAQVWGSVRAFAKPLEKDCYICGEQFGINELNVVEFEGDHLAYSCNSCEDVEENI